MKKRLNVFCVLMLVIMALEIVMPFILSFNDNAQAFSEGWQDGRDNSLTAGKVTVDVIMFLIAILILYLVVRSFVSFIKFILNVNHDKVFVRDNVPLLRWAGWGYLAAHIFLVIADSLENKPLEKLYFEHADGIVLSVFILIVAEVFTIGLKLKEEQDLTI